MEEVKRGHVFRFAEVPAGGHQTADQGYCSLHHLYMGFCVLANSSGVGGEVVGRGEREREREREEDEEEEGSQVL